MKPSEALAVTRQRAKHTAFALWPDEDLCEGSELLDRLTVPEHAFGLTHEQRSVLITALGDDATPAQRGTARRQLIGLGRDWWRADLDLSNLVEPVADALPDIGTRSVPPANLPPARTEEISVGQLMLLDNGGRIHATCTSGHDFRDAVRAAALEGATQ